MKHSKPPVMMYHGIISGPESIPHGREIGAELYDVSLEEFSRHMDWLKKGGYRTLHGAALGTSSDRAVVITFDDGEHNNFMNAWPVLREKGFTAYFFVTIRRIGMKGYMHWNELRELVAGGMVVGAHGYSHEMLTTLNEKQLQQEFVDSRRILEENLGVTIDSFSIPRGFYTDHILKIAQDAGYRQVFVSSKQTQSDACWPRIAVMGNWSLERFTLALHNKKPLKETVYDFVKGAAKKILGDQMYNRIRSTILEKNK